MAENESISDVTEPTPDAVVPTPADRESGTQLSTTGRVAIDPSADNEDKMNIIGIVNDVAGRFTGLNESALRHPLLQSLLRSLGETFRAEAPVLLSNIDEQEKSGTITAEIAQLMRNQVAAILGKAA